ncbi:UNVERIFIED_CONTAM: hypothetical protein Slati_4539900 [Sesamum latifolium]|uniref:Uncharacterized protein n=1 Tax=Sesamum latifolium TaxID=2727402 RepID=A0AAW2S1R5_9LAMI
MSPYLFVLVMEVLSLILRQVIDQDGGFSYHWKCGRCSYVNWDLLMTCYCLAKRIRDRFRRVTFPSVLGLPLLASRLSIADCSRSSKKLIVVLVVGMELHCHLLEIEKRLRHFLWKGNTEGGSAKVSWRQLTALPSGWIGSFTTGFEIFLFGRLVTGLDHGDGEKWYDCGIGSDPFVHYKVGDGTSFSLWHDPWHPLGPLISQFPLGPRHTSLPDSALLCTVLMDGAWYWPPITNMESIGITHYLPPIHGGADCIRWTGRGGSFSSAAAYDVYCPPGPQVGWSSLLVGTFKIPRPFHSLVGYPWAAFYLG